PVPKETLDPALTQQLQVRLGGGLDGDGFLHGTRDLRRQYPRSRDSLRSVQVPTSGPRTQRRVCAAAARSLYRAVSPRPGDDLDLVAVGVVEVEGLDRQEGVLAGA